MTLDHDDERMFDGWTHFRAILHRANIDAPTIELARHAFYAGAMASLLALLDVGQRHPTDVRAAADSVDRLRAELNAHATDVRRVPVSRC